MKILLIEDEIKTALYLKQGLEEQGYSVETCNDGEAGLQQALRSYFDLIILDVMLPGKNGWAVLTELRKARKQTLTVFLTARDGLDDRVHGLDLGADGYLVKPFAFTELTALVRNLLRRETRRNNQDILVVKDLTVDRVQRLATRAGTALDLTPKEFSLLVLLLLHRGEILNRMTISETIWNIHFDSGTNTVEVHIRRLRMKVDGPWEEKIIKTVRGFGYTIEAS